MNHVHAQEHLQVRKVLTRDVALLSLSVESGSRHLLQGKYHARSAIHLRNQENFAGFQKHTDCLGRHQRYLEWQSAILLQRGPADPKFQVDHSTSQKTRLTDLSHGITKSLAASKKACI